jgi:hypothetical protein
VNKKVAASLHKVQDVIGLMMNLKTPELNTPTVIEVSVIARAHPRAANLLYHAIFHIGVGEYSQADECCAEAATVIADAVSQIHRETPTFRKKSQ